MNPTTDWIMTSTGRQFFPLEPRLEDIHIGDIAHALGAVNRFNGHTREPYSVAQHSVLVSRQLWRFGTDVQLVGLLHDASEAYLCDVPRPLKQSGEFARYREAEERLQALIYRAFGVDVIAADPGVQSEVKLVDRRMLRTEQAALMPPAAHGEDREDVKPFQILISSWSAANASARFHDRFRELWARLQEEGR